MFDKLLSAGKRVVTGESLFTTMFTHGGQGKAKVAFAAPYPGSMMAMKLSEHGGRLVCQKDSFLAGARGASVGIHFQRTILTDRSSTRLQSTHYCATRMPSSDT